MEAAKPFFNRVGAKPQRAAFNSRHLDLGDAAPFRFPPFNFRGAASSLGMTYDVSQSPFARINVEEGWRIAGTGKGVHIAIVDTGIQAALPELVGRVDYDASINLTGRKAIDEDVSGHGTMCAAIAGARGSNNGAILGRGFSGVAPEATLVSCRVAVNQTDPVPHAALRRAYEYLWQQLTSGAMPRLVVSTSIAHSGCQSPGGRQDDELPNMVRRLVHAGAVVVFAAGNNHHQICQYKPGDCGPNSIWHINSLDEVLTVGATGAEASVTTLPPANRQYSACDSSRGPGEWANTTTKPNCVAPAFGFTIFGDTYRNISWWGTSGAAPLVAGLAALLLGHPKAPSSAQVTRAILSTCQQLPDQAKTCVGAGLIDCAAACRSL